MNDTLDLSCKLITKVSISPDDAGCMDLIVDYLKDDGFKPEWYNFGKTSNLWLKRGQRQPLLVFLGHTDVVPPGPESGWNTRPFEPTIQDDFLFGRGAADMKGAVAAITTALRKFSREHPDHEGSVALLLTSDEEADATDGVVKVMEALHQKNEKMDWCVIGEPSSFDYLGDVIRIGRRGSLSGILTIKGIQGHVAYPNRADNPIHRFAPALHELATTIWDHGNESFPPTSFQVSNIHSGTGADNVIPGALEATFNFRFSTEITENEIKQRVHAILDSHKLNYEIDWRLSGGPFLNKAPHLIEACQNAIEAITGKRARPDTGGGTSDGRFVAPYGIEVVEIGPLNATIHKLNECVSIKDLEQLADIYYRILCNLLLSR